MLLTYWPTDLLAYWTPCWPCRQPLAQTLCPHEPRPPVVKLSPPAEMPFTRAAAIQMLRWGANPDSSPYTHKQIAEWCDRFWCQYLDVDAEPEIESLLPTLTDVETQWDLYLANTYSIIELQTRDFEREQMPKEWFDDWLRRVA